ncbi:hypothetical protein [Rickettsiella endosymbiont of Aleochara curtula]|uniref:hypothetical protein n=1 Tax=Rickettsiella endosymbiont of Aleochara curtula TaxID=3077936 RepID=UPI00313BE366
MLDFIAEHRKIAINKEIEGLKQQLLTDKYERQDIEKKIEDLQKKLDIQCPSVEDIYANAKQKLKNERSIDCTLNIKEKKFFYEIERILSDPEFVPVDDPEKVIDYQIGLIRQLKEYNLIKDPLFNYLLALRLFDYKKELVSNIISDLPTENIPRENLINELKVNFDNEIFSKVKDKFANRLFDLLIDKKNSEDKIFELSLKIGKINCKDKLTAEQINYFSALGIINFLEKKACTQPDSDQDNAEYDLILPVVPEDLPSDEVSPIEVFQLNQLAHETFDLKEFQQITAAVLEALPDDKKIVIINQSSIAFTDIIHATLSLQDSHIDTFPVKNYFEQLFKKNVATFKAALIEHSIEIKPKYIEKLCVLCTLGLYKGKEKQLQNLKNDIKRNIFKVNNNNRTALYILDIFLKKYVDINNLSQKLVEHNPRNVTWNMKEGFSSIHIQQNQQPPTSHQNSIFLKPMQLSNRIPFLVRRNADEMKKIKALIDLMQRKKTHLDILTPVSFEKLMQSSLRIRPLEKERTRLFNQLEVKIDKVCAEFQNKRRKAASSERELTEDECSEYVTSLEKRIAEYKEKNSPTTTQQQGKLLKDAFFYKCRMVVLDNLKTKLMEIKSISPNTNRSFVSYKKYLKPIDKLMHIQKKLSLQQQQILQEFSNFILKKFSQLNLSFDEAQNVIASIQQHAICCLRSYSEKLNDDLLKNSPSLYDKNKKLYNKYAEVLQKIADSKQHALKKEALILKILDHNISSKKNIMYREEALSILHDTEQYLHVIDYLQRVSEWFDPEHINLYSNAIEFVNITTRQKKIMQTIQKTETGISTISIQQPTLTSVSQIAANGDPETNNTANSQTVSASYVSQGPLKVNFFNSSKTDSPKELRSTSLQLV